MKKILIAFTFSSLLITPSVFAESDSLFVPQAPTFSAVSVVKEDKEMSLPSSLKETQLKTRASRLIDERVKALAENKQAIEKNVKLTADQKAKLTLQIDTNTKALTMLKGEIASSTIATTTKSLTEAIFKDFRIFAIAIPKIRIESRIYQLQNHSLKLSDTFTKIQKSIDEHKAKGHDVTEWQKGLDNAKVSVAQSMFKIDEVFKRTATLTPSTYGTTSKATIDAINKDLRTISKELNSVISTVRKPDMKKRPKIQEVKQASSTVATTTVR